MSRAFPTHYARQPQHGDAIILQAIEILGKRLRKPGAPLSYPGQVRAFLMLQIAELEHEAFIVMFLDAQNRLIETEEMFRGTLTHTSVYPREVVKRALHHNAAAVILCHNHPSGACEPSHADELLTDAIKKALALVDVRVLDHFIVAGQSTPLSFGERGLL